MTQPTSLNVAYNTFDKYVVSTAMWATSIGGSRWPTYETFVWVYDKEQKARGKLLKQYYHENRRAALHFHFRFCKILAHRQLKQNLLDDSPFEETPF